MTLDFHLHLWQLRHVVQGELPDGEETQIVVHCLLRCAAVVVSQFLGIYDHICHIWIYISILKAVCRIFRRCINPHTYHTTKVSAWNNAPAQTILVAINLGFGIGMATRGQHTCTPNWYPLTRQVRKSPNDHKTCKQVKKGSFTLVWMALNHAVVIYCAARYPGQPFVLHCFTKIEAMEQQFQTIPGYNFEGWMQNFRPCISPKTTIMK